MPNLLKKYRKGKKLVFTEAEAAFIQYHFFEPIGLRVSAARKISDSTVYTQALTAHAYQTAARVADRAMSAASEALLVRGQTPAVLLALSERLLGLLPQALVGETE